MINLMSEIQENWRVLVNSVDNIYPCLFSSFGIENQDERDRIKLEIFDYMSANLLHNDFLSNLKDFENKTYKLVIPTDGWSAGPVPSNCSTPREQKALKKFCYDLRQLAQSAQFDISGLNH